MEFCHSFPFVTFVELNAALFNHLNQIEALKLEHLIGPKINSRATFDSQNTVVTIPENLPLIDSEKSVLSKGLNFVPMLTQLALVISP